MRNSDDDPRGTDLTTPLSRSKSDSVPDAERTTPLSGSEGSARSRGGAAAGQPVFSPGDLVSGRYKIVRFLAQGGMGEVYEAADLVLHERLALKTVLAEIAEDGGTIERFKREIHLARQISHPNVCRIFDVGHHRTGETEIVFFTMELLAGETLAERLDRAGPMRPAEALPIVRQMAAALEAAHEKGIIHRDFKSSNVVLIGAPDSPRAVVTDFGLARGDTTTDSFAASVSEIRHIVGTPAYMAPEQVEGGTIGPATDIYGLGVVMFEMVTGELPFRASTPLAMLAKRLKEPPSSPRIHVPELDPLWEGAILRCLERDPADRFASASDVARALGGETVKAGRKQRRRLTIAGAVVLAIITAVVMALVVDRIHIARERDQLKKSATTTTAAAPPPFPPLLQRSAARSLSSGSRISRETLTSHTSRRRSRRCSGRSWQPGRSSALSREKRSPG